MFKRGLIRSISLYPSRNVSAFQPLAPRLYSTASDEAVTVTRDIGPSGTPTGVVTVTLNKPKLLNALTVEMGEKFRDVVETLKADESIRAVVLTGEGRAFSAGGDMQFLKSRQTTPPQRNAETMRCV
jgi:enoyl-CoA hydratase/carnithine racemase